MMESESTEKLAHLNQEYNTNCKVKFVKTEGSFYQRGTIYLSLKSPDPLWTLCHEFKHFLQDSRKNYIFKLRFKIITHSLRNLGTVAIGYFLLFQIIPITSTLLEILSYGHIVIVAWVMGNTMYASPPIVGKKRELYKDICHHLEFEADKFATKHTGVIPYHEQLKKNGDEESISHPSWHARIASLEEEFPKLKA